MTKKEKLADKREKKNAYQRAHRAANKDLFTARHRSRVYGMSQEKFDEMFAAQGQACAVCLTKEPKGKGFHIDHCHETKVVRGVLCHHCNVGLGHFRDDTALLLRATEYLDAARTIQ